MKTGTIRTVSYALLILLVVGMVALPQLRKAPARTAGQSATHIHGLPEDFFYDLMVIRQGREYSAERDQYTTEPTSPAIIHPSYLVLGRIGGMTGASDTFMYYAGLYGAIVLYIVAVLYLVHQLVPGKFRWLAYLTVFFAGPFPEFTINIGGLAVPMGTGWWTEMDPLHRIDTMPHHITGTAWMLVSAAFAVRWIRGHRSTDAFAAGISSAIGAAAYNIPVVVMLLALWGTMGLTWLQGGVARIRKDIPGLLAATVPSALVLLWMQVQMRTLGYPWDSFLRWEYLWYNHSPKEIYPYTTWVFLVSFGILPFLAVPAVVQALRKRRADLIFPALMGGIPIILYILAAHHLIQLPKIRFAHAAPYVTLGILATLGIREVASHIRELRMRTVVTVCLIAVVSVNAIASMWAYWLPEVQKTDGGGQAVITAPYRNMLGALASYPPYSGVVAPYGIATYIPAYTPQNVFIGHMVNTKDYWTKWGLVQAFYTGKMTPDEAHAMLTRYGIRYVVWEGDPPPAFIAFLTKVFSDRWVNVFSVSP